MVGFWNMYGTQEPGEAKKRPLILCSSPGMLLVGKFWFLSAY